MSKKAKEIKIGVFTVVVLVGAFFGFNALKNNNVFGNDYSIVAVMNQTNGLETGASMLLKGYKVGNLQKIYYDLPSNSVIAHFMINGDYRFPVGTTFVAGSTSLLGGSAVMVNIAQGSGGGYISAGDTVLVSNKSSVTDMLGEGLEGVISKLSLTLDNINDVLSDENKASLAAIVKSVEGVAGDLQGVVSSQRGNLSSMISNLSALSATLKSMSPELQSAVSDASKVMADVKDTAPQLLANATKSVDNLSSILHKIDSGEGSTGKLVNDENLYVNLNQTLENLAVLVEDLQKNPKRYINVTVFGKRDKSDNK